MCTGIRTCCHSALLVFDRNRILQYVGRVDGSEKPGTGQGEDLRNAIDEVLGRKTVANTVTKVFGCSIKWSWKNEYTQKLYKQCPSCQ